MNAIFENYEHFIRENRDELSSPSDILRLLNDDGMFRAYKDALTEGMGVDSRNCVSKVLDAQRMSLLTEGVNVGPSAMAQGWMVMS